MAEQPEYIDPPAAKTADALNAPNANARVAGDFDAVAASPLKPQSALAANKDESDIGSYEYRRARAEQPYLRGAEAAINSPRPPVPSFEKIKREPNPEDYHKYSMEFAAAAAVLGAVAGRWTRAGGTASLNAFAGALQGWQKGNVQAYEEASKQWEQASKKTIENNNIELQKYKAILEDHKMNIEDKLHGLTIAGYENQNSVIVGMGKEGNFNGIAQAVDKMGQANERYGAAVGQLSGVRKDQWADTEGQIEQLNANPEMNEQYQVAHPKEWLALAGAAHARGLTLNQPPQGGGQRLQAAVDLAGQNQASLATIMSRMPAGDKPIFMRMLKEQYPNYQQQDFNVGNVEKTTEARTAASRIAKVDYAANLLDENIDVAADAAKAFPMGKFVPIDTAKLWAARQGSDVKLSEWDVVNLQILENYATLLNPNAQTIRKDMFDKAAGPLTQAKSTQAYLATLDAIRAAGQREKEAGRQTISEQRGGAAKVRAPLSGGGASGGVIQYDAQGNRVQ